MLLVVRLMSLDSSDTQSAAAMATRQVVSGRFWWRFTTIVDCMANLARYSTVNFPA